MQRSYVNGWQNRTRAEEIEHIEELRQIGQPLEHSYLTMIYHRQPMAQQ